MLGGELIREARKRAGLSQRELAEFMATTQPVIARWESGKSSPSFQRVVAAVRSCGFDLAVRIVARDDEHALLVQENLRLSPKQRLERLTSSRSTIDELAAKVRRGNRDDGV
ncbi:MAG: helix-turn-helix domain-containing protein [Actinomycetota bacterium]|nr:helix-turn-helix domain-containing protein [Actinomycetota bacterium]